MIRAKLTFNSSIAKKKPTNQDRCPFCYQEELGKVLDRQDQMIWVENKYPVLEQAYQTLIIESDWHDGDIPIYSRDYNRQLFSYAVEKFEYLEQSEKFKSVLCYKNFGPLSGGSLRHPHLQIVGLESVDGYAFIQESAFEGLEVQSFRQGARLVLSSDPIAGGLEFNIIISKRSHLEILADVSQLVLRFITHVYFKDKEASYNLFLYPIKEGFVCKIMPRYVVSPYLLGYGIRQVPSQKRLSQLKSHLESYLKDSLSDDI